MAYIGRDTDKLSNIEKLDTITFDGSSSYTLQKGGVNFTPSSANNLQVSIDGVVQAGNFTVSGSTIDFGVAIPSTSTNDFIFHYGTGLITTPADGTVDSGALSADAITGQTALAETPASDDQFLIYDTSATSFKKLAASYVGGTMTPAFSAYLSSNQNISGAFTSTKVQFDTEIFDTDSCYDNSTNYRFTPTTAGKYFISTNASFQTSSGNWTKPLLQIYKNGTGEAFARLAIDSSTALTGGADHTGIMVSAIFDANGSSDYFEVYFAGSSANCQLQGTASNRTSFNAFKIIE